MFKLILLSCLLSYITLFETSQCGDIFENAFLKLDENSILLVLNQSLQHTLQGFLLRLIGEGLINSVLQLKEDNIVVCKLNLSMFRLFKEFDLTSKIDSKRVETSHDSEESDDNCKIVISDNKLLRSLLLWGVVERDDLHIMEQLKNLSLTITLDIEKKHEDDEEDKNYVVKISVKGENLNEDDEIEEVLNDILLLIGAAKELIEDEPVGD